MDRICPQTTVRLGSTSQTSNRTSPCLLSRSFKRFPASERPRVVSATCRFADEDPEEPAVGAVGIADDVAAVVAVASCTSKQRDRMGFRAVHPTRSVKDR